MGNMKKIAITGAAGFIGRNIIRQARLQGLSVIAIVRNAQTSPENWQNDPLIERVECDLAVPDADAILHQALTSADTVIHAAAAMSGSAGAHQVDTLQSTKNLLSALGSLGHATPHLVLISSIAVYDYAALKSGQLVDETALLEQNPDQRDTYAAAKVAQETMVSAAAKQQGFGLTILRPGAVYDANHMFNAHLGPAIGPLLISLGLAGDVPLCHIENCVDAILRAAINCPDGVFNLLDDDLPSRREFIAVLAGSGWPSYRIPIAFSAAMGLAKTLSLMPWLDAKSPGFLRKSELRARMLPLRFDNRKARRTLNWVPNSKLYVVDNNPANTVNEVCHV